MKLRVIIVDDESLARERLKRLLRSEANLEMVAECENGEDAVQAIQAHRPDLVFLDIQMPGMDGFGVLRALGENLPFVVFVTAFDEHAVRAFESRALDYLLKPTTAARLAESIKRVRERLSSAPKPEIPQALLDLLNERKAAEQKVRRFAVRNGERTVFVDADEVDWIEAAGNYAILHVGKATHILRETMAALESQLEPDVFFRVSRSAIVHLRRIRELQSVAPGEQVAILRDGQRIGVTKNLREIEERLRFA